MELIEDLGMLKPKETSNYKVRYGLYQCPVCEKAFKVITNSVKSGKSTQCNSCGNIKAKTTHGMSKTSPNYNRWEQMKQRCTNPKSPKYSYYGGNGITVCDEWSTNFTAYNDYIMSLPNAIKKGYTVDRIDSSKGYTKGNIRWASKTLQARNCKTSTTSKSGVSGVTWDTQRQKWFASITIDAKQKNLGRYLDLEDAINARKSAEDKHNFLKENK